MTEIAAICALESGARIVATVDQSAKTDSFVGLPLVKTFDDLDQKPAAVVITNLLRPREKLRPPALSRISALDYHDARAIALKFCNQIFKWCASRRRRDLTPYAYGRPVNLPSEGTLLLTKQHAPMATRSPMTTPFAMTAFGPTKQWSPIEVGA